MNRAERRKARQARYELKHGPATRSLDPYAAERERLLAQLDEARAALAAEAAAPDDTKKHLAELFERYEAMGPRPRGSSSSAPRS